MRELVIVVPLWKRTNTMDRLIASVEATTTDARLLFVVKQDDEGALAATERLDRLVVEWPGGGGGDYARSINAGYQASDERFIFTGADDIEFTDGWWEVARAHAALDRIGVVGTNDACNPRTYEGTHSTHSLVARWYANAGAVIGRPGTIYFEGYDHDYCDDELVETAKSRNAYAHAVGAVVRHHHPMVGAAPDDETYQRGRSRSRISRSLFRRRERLWRTQ